MREAGPTVPQRRCVLVAGATTVHDDVVDVGWTVWGDQWDFWLDHLDADIAASSGVAPTQAWLRPRSLGADVEIGADALVVTARAASEQERERLWAVVTATYAGYARYQARTARRIPVVLLTPEDRRGAR